MSDLLFALSIMAIQRKIYIRHKEIEGGNSPIRRIIYLLFDSFHTDPVRSFFDMNLHCDKTRIAE